MVSHTTDQIDMLKELCKERTCWVCMKCSEIMKKLNGRLAAVEKDLKEVKNDLGEVKQKQSETDETLVNVEKDVVIIKKEMKSNTNNMKSSVMSEMNQREMRKANIIIHRVVEAQLDDRGASSREAVNEKEKDNLCDLFNKMSLNSAEVRKNIKFSKRLGPKKDNGARPLLLGFKNARDRDLVMDAALKQNSHHVSFTSDLTKMQREENERLRNEVQQLNYGNPSDESGDYWWRLVGPPEMLRKAKTRGIEEWERKEETRRQHQQRKRTNQLNQEENNEEEE